MCGARRPSRGGWIETQVGRWKDVIGPKLRSRRNHVDHGRPDSPEHNDRTRTTCVRTPRLTLRLGERGNSTSAPVHATTLPGCTSAAGHREMARPVVAAVRVQPD